MALFADESAGGASNGLAAPAQLPTSNPPPAQAPSPAPVMVSSPPLASGPKSKAQGGLSAQDLSFFDSL